MQYKYSIITILIFFNLVSTKKPSDKCFQHIRSLGLETYDYIVSIIENPTNYETEPIKKIIRDTQGIIYECTKSNYNIEEYELCVNDFVAVIPYMKMLIQCLKENDKNGVIVNGFKIFKTVKEGIHNCSLPKLRLE